jgi:hypothetical protein
VLLLLLLLLLSVRRGCVAFQREAACVRCWTGGVREVRDVANRLLGELDGGRNVECAVWREESGRLGQGEASLTPPSPNGEKGIAFAEMSCRSDRAGADRGDGGGAGGAHSGLEGCACADPPSQPVGITGEL